MDSLRAFDDDADYSSLADEPAIEAPPEIGTDERRMHVRAYNYWVSMLNGRAYPSIGDLDPNSLTDFGPHSVLLDFTANADDPAVVFLGPALRTECSLPGDIQTISDVPKRSLLSRLTDHYLQIIANAAPIGFEAEFVGQRGRNTMYRGILMPFSSTGETIDFIYGVINWKELVDSAAAAELDREVDRALATAPAAGATQVWADGPNAQPTPSGKRPVELYAEEPELELAAPDLGPDAGLYDRLAAARDTAEAAGSADVRSRAALYRALGLAYDFARAAAAEPEDYAEILEDAGLKAQARAPMTPVAKLIFGTGHDKARLTEYAAALSWACRQGLPGGFEAYLESYDGGLKGVVSAERRARRPEPKADILDGAREALRAAEPLAYVDVEAGAVEAGEEEFILLVARRVGGSRLAVVAPASGDAKLLERAIRLATR